jgi:hypothetical protein
MRYPFIALILLIAAASCKNKSATANAAGEQDTIKFFPVSALLKTEIDSTAKNALAIFRTTEVDGVTKDSGLINADQFKQLSKPFLEQDITTAEVKKYYQESVFRDLTTNTTMVTYKTQNRDVPVQAVDISMNDDNTVKRYDITAYPASKDSTIKVIYAWVPGIRFSISRYAEGKDGKGITQQTNVRWYKKP